MRKIFVLFISVLVSISMMAQNQKPFFVYVGDPMCSWCYGFAPELQKLEKQYENKVDFKIIVGGLRPYRTEPIDEQLSEFLREHLVEIEKRSGEKFNFGVLDDKSFILDTEPSCRAYKVLEAMGADKIIGFHEVQKVFYVKNDDPKKVESYLPVCEKLNLNFKEFKQKFESDEFKTLTRNDFAAAQQMGVTGFPTLLMVVKDQAYILSRGYQEAENLFPQIEKLLIQ